MRSRWFPIPVGEPEPRSAAKDLPDTEGKGRRKSVLPLFRRLHPGNAMPVILLLKLLPIPERMLRNIFVGPRTLPQGFDFDPELPLVASDGFVQIQYHPRYRSLSSQLCRSNIFRSWPIADPQKGFGCIWIFLVLLQMALVDLCQ